MVKFSIYVSFFYSKGKSTLGHVHKENIQSVCTATQTDQHHHFYDFNIFRIYRLYMQSQYAKSKADQTVSMCSLIRVFPVHTGQKIPFHMTSIICSICLTEVPKLFNFNQLLCYHCYSMTLDRNGSANSIDPYQTADQDLHFLPTKD